MWYFCDWQLTVRRWDGRENFASRIVKYDDTCLQKVILISKLLTVQIAGIYIVDMCTIWHWDEKLSLVWSMPEKKEGRRVLFHYSIPLPSFLSLFPASPILTQMKIISIMKGYKIYNIGGEGTRIFFSLRAWWRVETEQRWEQETIKRNYSAQINPLNSCTVK